MKDYIQYYWEILKEYPRYAFDYMTMFIAGVAVYHGATHYANNTSFLFTLPAIVPTIMLFTILVFKVSAVVKERRTNGKTK